MISINLSIILLCYIVVMSTLRGVVIIRTLKEKLKEVRADCNYWIGRYDYVNHTLLEHQCPESVDEENPLLK